MKILKTIVRGARSGDAGKITLQTSALMVQHVRQFDTPDPVVDLIGPGITNYPVDDIFVQVAAAENYWRNNRALKIVRLLHRGDVVRRAQLP